MRKCAFALVIVMFVGLFAACGDDDGGVVSGDESTTTAPEDSVQKVAVKAADFSYSGPKEFKAGTVEFTLENTGKAPHILVLTKLDAGKTADDLKAFWSAPPQGPPPGTDVGGIATTDAGLFARATWQVPDAGDYAFVCLFPNADGTTHASKGMVSAVTVTDGDTTDLPEVDGTAKTSDFKYDAVPTFTAGKESEIGLENAGPQDHEFTLIEFKPGKTPADLASFFATQAGEPPVIFHGGVAVGKGQKATYTAPALEKGKTYYFMCLIPDPADGQPHASKGMVAPLTVT